MNYGIFSSDFTNTYGERYTPPYWMYTVIPRNYDQPLYRAELDFGEEPYNLLNSYFQVLDGDILEAFLMQHRVLVTGVAVQIVMPADIIIQPVTRSGILFDPIDCSVPSDRIYTPYGGILDRATDIAQHSFRVEEPDYIGFKVISGSANLNDLSMVVTVSVSDEFSLDTLSNSTKDT